MQVAVSIVIPAYNEEGVIEETISLIHEQMSSLDMEYQIVVVNDGSTDRTGEILRSRSDILLLDRKVNRGYGFSLKQGIRAARYDWIAIIDADGTYPIYELPNFVALMDGNDMVIGERTGAVVNVGFFNRTGKMILRILAFVLTRQWIRDLNSGMRLFRKSIAEKYWHMLPNAFSFTTTITLASIIDGANVHFHRINYYKRVGRSSIKPFRDFFNFSVLILKIVTYFKPLNVFLPFSATFFMLTVARALRDILKDNNIGTLAIILFLISVQAFFFGLIADLIVTKFKKDMD